MLSSYDMTAFGAYLKNLRKNMRFTQDEIIKRTNVSIDTLRRIEQGKVVPKYETIESLSIVYKEDLTSIFRMFSRSRSLFCLYQKIDEILIDYDSSKFCQIEDALGNLIEENIQFEVVNQEEIDQLKLFIEGSKLFWNNDFESAKNVLLRAIRLTNQSYKIEDTKTHKMNMMEARIALLIALSISELGDSSKGIPIMKEILKLFVSNGNLRIEEVHLKTKLYFNISYKYYKVKDYKKSLHYADEGIKFCRSKQSMYCLYMLYYRRAIAKYSVGNKGYKNDLSSCYRVLELLGRTDLIKSIKEITLEVHSIE